MYVQTRTSKAGEKTHRYKFQFLKTAYYGRYVPSKAAARKAGDAHLLGLKTGTIAPKSAEAERDARVQSEADAIANMTLDNACAIYWRDVGQRTDSAPQLWQKIADLKRLLGAEIRIRDIFTATVMAAREQRRQEPVINREKLLGMANVSKTKKIKKATQAKLHRRAAALRLLIEGKSGHATWKETGFSWATCKRYRRDLLASRANGVSDAAWLADKLSKTINGRRPQTKVIVYRSAKLPEPGTVNRDIIGVLRPILGHVAALHEYLALPTINWKMLRIPEPKKIVREYSEPEIMDWASRLNLRTVEIFLGFCLTYGPRFGEMFFPPDALVDPYGDDPILVLGAYTGRGGEQKSTRKADDLLKLHIMPAHAALLAPLAARAAELGFPSIWIDYDKFGRPYPITYWGMYSRIRRAAAKTSIKAGRLVHGMRHHAGTRILRETGNLVLVKETLGHSDIRTSAKYAHANAGDMRRGYAAVTERSHTQALLSTEITIEGLASPVEDTESSGTKPKLAGPI